MKIDFKDETPETLAQSFASGLITRVQPCIRSEFEHTIKTMIVSSKLSAQAVLLLVFQERLKPEEGVAILLAIESEFVRFIFEKFGQYSKY